MRTLVALFFLVSFCPLRAAIPGGTPPREAAYFSSFLATKADCPVYVLLRAEVEKTVPEKWITDEAYLHHFNEFLRAEPDITINEFWLRTLPHTPQFFLVLPADLTYSAEAQAVIRQKIEQRIKSVTPYLAGKFAPLVLANQILLEAEYELVKVPIKKLIEAKRDGTRTNYLADRASDPLRKSIYQLLRRFEYLSQFALHHIYGERADDKPSQDILHRLIGAWLLLNDVTFTEKHRVVRDGNRSELLRPCYLIHPEDATALGKYAILRRDTYKDRPYEVLVNAWINSRTSGTAYTSDREEFMSISALIDDRWRKDADRTLRVGFQYLNNLDRGEAMPLQGVMGDRLQNGLSRTRALAEPLLRQSDLFHGLRHEEGDFSNEPNRVSYAFRLALAAEVENGATQSHMRNIDGLLNEMEGWLDDFHRHALDQRPWDLRAGNETQQFYSAKSKTATVTTDGSWYASFKSSSEQAELTFYIATIVDKRPLTFSIGMVGSDYAGLASEVGRRWEHGGLTPRAAVPAEWEDLFYGALMVTKRRLEVSRRIFSELTDATAALLAAATRYLTSRNNDDFEAMLRVRRESQRWSVERTTLRELTAPRTEEKQNAIAWLIENGEPIPRLPFYLADQLQALVEKRGSLARNTVLENVGMRVVQTDLARFGIRRVRDVHHDEPDHDLEFELPQAPGIAFPVEVKATLVEDGQVLDRTFYLSREEIQLLNPRTNAAPALLAIVVIDQRGAGRVHYFRNPDLGGDLHPSEPGRNFGVYEFLRKNDPRRGTPELPRIPLTEGEI